MRNGGDRPMRPPRKPSVTDVDQVQFDHPDDAELESEDDATAVVDDAETLMAPNNPDDADMYDVDMYFDENEGWSSERGI